MTTEAGKRLLDEDNHRTRLALAVWCVEHGFASPEHLVDAIEAQAYDDGVVDQKLATLDAVTAALDALAAEVTNYFRTTEKAWYGVDEKSIDAENALAAVLALIAEEKRIK